jgi:DNA-directed RNA polymerase subunit RPC12/RpoP
MNKRDYKDTLPDGYLLCTCGHRIHTNIYDQTIELAKDLEDDREKEDIVCPLCGAKYHLYVAATCKVEVNCCEAQLIEQPRINAQQVRSLCSLLIGDTVNLDDDEYCLGKQLYVVKNRRLIGVFNSEIDENQLSFSF